MRENLRANALKRSVDGGFVKNGGPQNSPSNPKKSHISEKFARMNMTLTGVFWLNPLLHKAYRRQVGVHPQKNSSILLFPHVYLLGFLLCKLFSYGKY